MTTRDPPKPSRQLRPAVVALQKASVEKMVQALHQAREHDRPPRVLGTARRIPLKSPAR